MPRINELPNEPATPDWDDEIPFYDKSERLTNKITVGKLAEAINSDIEAGLAELVERTGVVEDAVAATDDTVAGLVDDPGSATGAALAAQFIALTTANRVDGEVPVWDAEAGVWVSGSALSSEGLPSGGATGQVLAKKSGTDLDTEWVDQAGGGGGGEPGVDGASAYEVAVDNGFVGTEEQWLASLVGPEGIQGEPGETGAQGEPGETGPAGTTDYNELSNRPTLGTAAVANVGDFATAAQGTRADSALQSSDAEAFVRFVIVATGDEARPGASGGLVIWSDTREAPFEPTNREPQDWWMRDGQPLVAPFVGFSGVTGTFAPEISLVSGSTADVSWRDSADEEITTGLTPSITAPGDGIVRMVVTDAGASAFGDVEVINLGFDSTQDAGRYNIGSGWNHDPQPLTGITNLALCTSLRYFMAAETSLTGTIDFAGLAVLEHIECYQSAVSGVVLTGCTSLIRLCLEQCHVTGTLDLTPVAANLYDLRAAYQFQSGTANLAIVTEDPMANLYHYCVRRNAITAHIAMADLPVIEEWWVWNTGITTMDVPVSDVLTSVLAYDSAISTATVDAWLVALDVLGAEDGTIRFDDADAPTTASDTARAALVSKGWNLTVPESSGSPTAPTITTASLNSMTEGTSFSQTLAATGSTPITWTVTDGALPDGLTLSSGGLISGTPTEAGAYSAEITATNSEGSDGETYTGSVAEPSEAGILPPAGIWPDVGATDTTGWSTPESANVTLDLDDDALTATWGGSNGYARIITSFGGEIDGPSTTRAVKVTFTRADLVAGPAHWGICLNTDSSGNEGLRFRWTDTSGALTGTNLVSIGRSNGHSTNNVSVSDVNAVPAGWTDSGEHSVTMALSDDGTTCDIYLDDVHRFTATVPYYDGGGYVGLCGDALSGNTRTIRNIEVE